MKLLTVAEAAALVNSKRNKPITEKAIYQLVYRGRVPFIRIGSAVMIFESGLENFLSAKHKTGSLPARKEL